MERPDTDPRRIGIVGCSIGAIVASLAVGQDPRLSAGVFVMGGAHLDEIFASCYGDEAEVREMARARFGWDTGAFQQAVKGPLAAVDPVRTAGNIDPAGVLYIDAGRDSCIPRSARDELWEAMGRPERVTLGYDHKKSFLTMTFLGFDRTTERIVNFLGAKLNPQVDLSAGPTAPTQGGMQPQ
jgi:dienelactone hydrolase